MLTEIKVGVEHYFVDENGLIQGEYTMHHESYDDRLYLRCFYVNNKRHGEFKTWFCNRRLDVHCFYVNGLLHGEYKSLYVNGSTHHHCFYVNNKHVSFDEIPYPETNEELMLFKLKYDLQLLPVETTC